MIISGVTLQNVGYVVDVTPVTNGLRLYLDSSNATSWPGSGTTWYDLSGLGYNATLYSSPTATNGIMHFTAASGQYAQGPNLGTNLTSWTACIWCRFTSLNSNAGDEQIFTNVFTGTPNTVNYSLGFFEDNKVHAGIFDASGTLWHETPGTVGGTGLSTGGGYTVSTGTWYHLSASYNGTTLKFYVNGTLNSSLSYTGGTYVSTQGYRVARRWDNANYVDGDIPVIMMYNRQLTDVEVAQNFNAQRSRYGI